MMDYRIVIDLIGLFLSSFGATVILFGSIEAIIKILVKKLNRHHLDINAIRIDYTSKIMLGLEFFIAGDLMKTIFTPGLNEVIILALIVAIRTVIGYSLNLEIKNDR
jgi:uncharacterized membrane protein